MLAWLAVKRDWLTAENHLHGKSILRAPSESPLSDRFAFFPFKKCAVKLVRTLVGLIPGSLVCSRARSCRAWSSRRGSSGGTAHGRCCSSQRPRGGPKVSHCQAFPSLLFRPEKPSDYLLALATFSPNLRCSNCLFAPPVPSSIHFLFRSSSVPCPLPFRFRFRPSSSSVPLPPPFLFRRC
jgi:hypothetical protein